MRAGFKKVGDWAKVHSLVGSLRLEFDKARVESLKEFGTEMEKTVRDHITKQDLLWANLSPKYLAEKSRKGWSELTYVRTGSYFKNIRSYVRQGAIYVGFLPAARTPEGKSLVKIAKVLEFGSKINKTPARPLWRPSFNEVFKKFKIDNKPVKVLLDNLKRRFKI